MCPLSRPERLDKVQPIREELQRATNLGPTGSDKRRYRTGSVAVGRSRSGDFVSSRLRDLQHLVQSNCWHGLVEQETAPG